MMTIGDTFEFICFMLFSIWGIFKNLVFIYDCENIHGSKVRSTNKGIFKEILGPKCGTHE